MTRRVILGADDVKLIRIEETPRLDKSFIFNIGSESNGGYYYLPHENSNLSFICYDRPMLNLNTSAMHHVVLIFTPDDQSFGVTTFTREEVKSLKGDLLSFLMMALDEVEANLKGERGISLLDIVKKFRFKVYDISNECLDVDLPEIRDQVEKRRENILTDLFYSNLVGE